MVTTPLKVLLVGPPVAERKACETTLRAHKLRFTIAAAPPEAGATVGGAHPNLCVLVCSDASTAQRQVEAVRAYSLRLPLLAVNATPDQDLSVTLLQAGADDAIGPSQILAQLAARVRALHRRHSLVSTSRQNIPLVAGDLKIDLGMHKVWAGEREVLLSPTEFRILRKLSIHVGRVVPHRDLFIAAWGEQRPELSDALRVYIRHIRRKVQAAGDTVTIITRPGVGYMLSVPT